MLWKALHPWCFCFQHNSCETTNNENRQNNKTKTSLNFNVIENQISCFEKLKRKQKGTQGLMTSEWNQQSLQQSWSRYCQRKWPNYVVLDEMKTAVTCRQCHVSVLFAHCILYFLISWIWACLVYKEIVLETRVFICG